MELALANPFENEPAGCCTKPVTKPASTPRSVLDKFDRLPQSTLPDFLARGGLDDLLRSIDTLASEGAHGPAARELLARDVQLARAQVRFRESALNIEVERFIQGHGDSQRVTLMEKLVSGAHRRLLESLELFLALDRGSQARITVRAEAAQVNVGGDR
jgi:hypothetical protein